MIRITPLVLLLGVWAACDGCNLPSQMSPAVARQSIYRVESQTAGGTAFVISHGLLLTAGHLCVHAAENFESIYLEDGLRLAPTKVLGMEMSEGPEQDLCVLSTDVETGAPLEFSSSLPWKYESTLVIGYPHGDYAETRGVWTGGGRNTAPCDHGNSGSPILTMDGVVGVLVQAPSDDPTGKTGCLSTELPEIRAFLHWTKVL